jgi:lysozyme family protein
MEKKNIFYVIGIVAVLGIVFISQQGVFNNFGQAAQAAISGYWAKGTNWASDNAYQPLSTEAQKRGEIIGNEINSGKEKISENVLQKVGDYFSGIADSIVNPGNNSCPAPAE